MMIRHYVVLRASSATEKQHHEWVGRVESKIQNTHISLAHVNAEFATSPRKDNDTGWLSTKWLTGLLKTRCLKTEKQKWPTVAQSPPSADPSDLPPGPTNPIIVAKRPITFKRLRRDG
ncbi:uncharacterized protein V6R79_025571 [Siganus canaliculatus]